MTTHFSPAETALLLKNSPDRQSLSSTERRRLFPAPPSHNCEVIVVIPVKDEQETLAATLKSLAMQLDAGGNRLDPDRYEVLLLINNSSDDSYAIARGFAQAHHGMALHIADVNLPEPCAHVGQARRLLMDAASERLQRIGGMRSIIATTDADTVVDPTWLSATIEAVENGADAVGGRIQIHQRELKSMDPAARMFHLRDVGYRYLICQLEASIDPPPGDPWPRHFQHFGASLALTAETYHRVGGLPVRRSLEDVALYERLCQIDATIRHSPDVRVFTSARQAGRTEFGFAVQLQHWAEMQRSGRPFQVRSANDVIDEFQTRRAMRHLWAYARSGSFPDSAGLRRHAQWLAISPSFLADALLEEMPFGKFWRLLQQEQRADRVWSSRYPRVDITEGIRDLRLRIACGLPGTNLSQTLQHIEPVEFLSPVSQMA
jgi:hypothetical protein